MTPSSERIVSLDMAKGLLILLMTVSHIGLVQVNRVNWFNHHWLFLFKLPCFYIISGYLMSRSIGQPRFIRRKFDSLVKPYLALIILVITPFSFLIGYPLSIENIAGMIVGYDYNLGDSGLSIYPAWFIINLFVSFFICYVILLSVSKQNIFMFSLIVSLMVIANKYNSWNYFHTDTAIYSVVFLLTGFLLRRLSINIVSEPRFIFFGVFFVVIRLAFDYKILHLDIAQNTFGSFFAVYTCAVFGSLFFIYLVSLIKNQFVIKPLGFLSKNSLFILVLHVPVWRYLTASVTLPLGILSIVLYYVAAILVCVLIGEALRRLDKRGLLFKAKGI